MGKAQRTKGHSWERSIAVSLRHIDPTARRNVQETQIASVDILTEIPIAIQAKCLKRWSLTPHSIWEQANDGKLDPSHIPVGIVKIDRKKPNLVILDFDHFVSMLEKLYGKTTEDNVHNT